MGRRKFWLALLILLSIQVARARVRPCTVAKSARAMDKADMLRSWDALHRSYREYGNCDDKAVAEGV